MRMEKNTVILSEPEYEVLINRICAHPLDAFHIKVERAIKKRIQDVEAIRLYIPKLLANLNSTVERGEHPTLLIKRTIREKTGKPEIEIVFMASAENRHLEKIYAKNPQDWKSIGHIVLSIPQTYNFLKALEWLLKGQTELF